MKTAKRIILLIAIGLFPSILLAEGEPLLSASVSQDSDYSISQAELKKGRPANGFKLVYSENDAVCQPVLAALNEPGYDSRYFNQSDKFENTLPELLIQTRLNVPRTLIGTHLYRTEEYEIKDAESGNKEYWYRFIGQGEYLFGRALGVKKSWFKEHKTTFRDFMTFIDEGLPYPDCYYNKEKSCSGDRYAIEDLSSIWMNKKFQEINKLNGTVFDFSTPLVIDAITIDSNSYLISIGRYMDKSEYIKITLSDVRLKNYKIGRGVCFLESKFKVIGHD